MGRKRTSTGKTIALLVIAGVAFLILFPCSPCSRKVEIARRAACVNNLKQFGLAFDLYGSENKGRYPVIDDTKNNFIFEGDALFPEYFKYASDASIVACPSDPDFDPTINFRLRSNEHHPDCKVGEVHPDCITDMSYVYLGWLVTSDEEAEAFFEAYDKLAPEDRDKDIVVADGKGNGGSNVIHRLKRGAESFLNDPPKTAADIPIVWDRPYTDPANFSHIPPSGNVLYLDGHIEFVKLGEKFPMTETMARLLDERPRAPIPDCEPLED